MRSRRSCASETQYEVVRTRATLTSGVRHLDQVEALIATTARWSMRRMQDGLDVFSCAPSAGFHLMVVYVYYLL